jgi:MFS transporter, putative metabolite:H+ symporter
MTFVGMTIGALAARFLGDAFGRRFTYQVNLLVCGLASLTAVLAPTMSWLIAARFLTGLGLGAEIVVGYSRLTEFVPPSFRGRWLSFMASVVVSGLPGTALLGSILIPTLGWRAENIAGGAVRPPCLLDCRYRRSLRLVPAEIYAGIATLAGIKAPIRRG